MTNIDQLATLVQGLPPELYNTIYEFTFSPSTDTINVTRSCRPPSELQVDRTSREFFARQYYGNSKFITTDMDITVHWLRVLRLQHLQYLQDVKLLFISDNDEGRARDLRMAVRWLAETASDGSRGVDLRRLDCTFLRVQDRKTGMRTEPVSEVEFNGMCGMFLLSTLGDYSRDAKDFSFS